MKLNLISTLKFFTVLIALLFISCSKENKVNKEEYLVTQDQSLARNCATDDVHDILFNKNPELRPESNKAYKLLEDYTKNFASRVESNANYTIPVVVHIVHDNGAENISDQAVLGGIQDLNDGMKGQTQNESFIQPEFTGIKSENAPIEFVLAKYDPNGNPTSGIIRHQNSTYTVAGDNLDMKRDYGWPREKYLNIYVTRKARATSNTSGFAYYPYSVDADDQAFKDGVVIAYWAFGRHANLYNEWYYIITHEVGHWLNLIHIWGETSNGSRRACRYDDQVSDTPNTQGNGYQERSQCGTRETSCSSLDNTTNHMDYCAPCQAMFTQEQMDRMFAALNSPVADRNNLWSATNLDFVLNGIGDGGNNCDNLTDVQNLNATKVGKNWRLSWDVVNGAESYELEYRIVGGNWASVLVTNTEYTMSVSRGVKYEARVRALCGTQVSNWSTTVLFN